MNPDEQAIRHLVALWHRATAAGDVDTVLTLMADDVIFLVTGQVSILREQANGAWVVIRDANMLSPAA